MVNVSNRHIHLCAADAETLFGVGHQLLNIKNLMQPGEFACKETVSIVGKRGQIDSVRILVPLRTITQVEISQTDARKIAVSAPVRPSGVTSNSAPIKIVGPVGTVELKEGCIVAQRHLHMTVADAAFYGIANGELISVSCSGERGLIFQNIIARVSDAMTLECHLDTDEANAAGLKNGALVTIL